MDRYSEAHLKVADQGIISLTQEGQTAMDAVKDPDNIHEVVMKFYELYGYMPILNTKIKPVGE